MNVVTLPAILLTQRTTWYLSFLDSNDAAIDLTGATIAVSAQANNQSWADPTITATLDSATTAPQASAAFDTADYGSLTAPTILYVKATATISGQVVSACEFYQPIVPPGADNTALVDVDEVSKSILGVTYANLTTADKSSVDVAVFQARERVGQWAQHFSFAGPDGYPDPWKRWARVEAEVELASSRRPERSGDLYRQRDEVREAAITSFVHVPQTGGVMFGTAMTLMDVRKYVMASCVRQPKRLFVDPMSIDATLQAVLTEFWNRGDWSFRRRPVQIYLNPISISGGNWTESSKTISGIVTTDYTHVTGTILRTTDGTSVFKGDFLIASKPGNTSLTTVASISKTAGNLSNTDIDGTIMAVTVTGLGSGETLDQIGTKKLRDENGVEYEWATPDQYAYRLSQTTVAGVWPYVFRLENHGSFKSWKFDPIPSEAVVLHGQALISGPTLPSGAAAATDTATLAAIPSKCWPYLREATLYAILDAHGTAGGAERRVRLAAMLSPLMSQFVDQGIANEDKFVEDVYGDYQSMTGGSHFGGW